MKQFRLIVPIAVLFVLCTGGQSWSQAVKVAVQEGPLYANEPVLVRVTAEDFEEKPEPSCDPGKLPPGLSIKAVGVRPSVSSFTQVINGKVTSYRKVVYAYDYQVTANRPGSYRVPPFTVRQNQTAKTTHALALSFQEIPTDKDMRVSMILPARPVFPGQRVPVTIEWWYAGELNDVRDLSFRSPVFDQFTFITEPLDAKDTFLPITTQKGLLRLKAKMTKRKLDGREYLVVTATPLLVANQPGDYDVKPITVTMNKVTRWGRDIFGRRQPAAKVRLRAVGKPGKLTIRELPMDQAPASFAGAIGRGFTLAVDADRTVVRVEDPITLKIVLRGQGNLTSAALPPLSAAGLDPKRFRWPSGEVPGSVSGDSKLFNVTVRVLDESVAEIPELSYSWFDPELGRFQTAHSHPIALRVQGTQIVRAEDVVSAAPTATAEEPVKNPQIPIVASPTSGKPSGGGDLTGADLAIETRSSRLLVNESQRYGGTLARAVIYGLSILCVVVAWIWRRVVNVDPEVQRRRKLFREQVERVRRAAGLPRQEAARQIAAAVRAMATQVNGPPGKEAEEILQRCDDLTYAPDTGAREPVDKKLHRRAMEWVLAMAKETS